MFRNGMCLRGFNLAFIASHEVDDKRTVAHELLHMKYMSGLKHVFDDGENLMSSSGSGKELRMCELENVDLEDIRQWEKIRNTFGE